MSLAVRAVAALVLWAACFALGWRWAAPPVDGRTRVARPDHAASRPVVAAASQPDAELARRIASADPMALARTGAGVGAAAAAASAPAAELLAWRIAAAVVRGTERYVVLTAPDQPTKQVRQGEKLPDGDLLKAVHPNRIVVQSPRGRTRTIHLSEP